MCPKYVELTHRQMLQAPVLQVESFRNLMLNQDVWQFHIEKGKHTTKVCVHLDLTEEPVQDEIVKI